MAAFFPPQNATFIFPEHTADILPLEKCPKKTQAVRISDGKNSDCGMLKPWFSYFKQMNSDTALCVNG